MLLGVTRVDDLMVLRSAKEYFSGSGFTPCLQAISSTPLNVSQAFPLMNILGRLDMNCLEKKFLAAKFLNEVCKACRTNVETHIRTNGYIFVLKSSNANFNVSPQKEEKNEPTYVFIPDVEMNLHEVRTKYLANLPSFVFLNQNKKPISPVLEVSHTLAHCHHIKDGANYVYLEPSDNNNN